MTAPRHAPGAISRGRDPPRRRHVRPEARLPYPPARIGPRPGGRGQAAAVYGAKAAGRPQAGVIASAWWTARPQGWWDVADWLSELVDAPGERLDVEYKAWLDLTAPKHRADIARYIAELASPGGGHLVLGINDDLTSSCPASHGLDVDQGDVAAIARKYLEPPVDCDVRPTRFAAGVEHPDIAAPPHGPTPICAKANGPEIGGKVTGIVATACYLRKPGPESGQIATASEWRDVIRPRALLDRAAIEGRLVARTPS